MLSRAYQTLSCKSGLVVECTRMPLLIHFNYRLSVNGDKGNKYGSSSIQDPNKSTRLCAEVNFPTNPKQSSAYCGPDIVSRHMSYHIGVKLTFIIPTGSHHTLRGVRCIAIENQDIGTGFVNQFITFEGRKIYIQRPLLAEAHLRTQ